jgi:redox-sensitive bicupin YhaK (pirin superfamily)
MESPSKCFGLHPHSGIATLTYVAEGSVRYEETNGRNGCAARRRRQVDARGRRGVAWRRCSPGRTRGFQLWVALPPKLELGPSISLFLGPEAIQHDGPASVLLGNYGSATSPIEAPSPINYLAVRLKKGERWRYEPPAGHTVLWVAVGSGAVAVPDELQYGDLAAFEPSNDAIEVEAQSDGEFVVGSAVRHDHGLVLGYYSVHTSADALHEGEARISAIRARLVQEGRLR